MEPTLIEKIGSVLRTVKSYIVYALRNEIPLIFAGLTFFVSVTVLSLIAPPRNFDVQSYVDIPPGTTLREVSQLLKEQDYIKNKQLFEFLVVMFGRDSGVLANEYFFENKITSLEIAWRLVRGDTRIATVPITFFEGMTVKEMKDLLVKHEIVFDAELFMDIAQNKEGYLFPDTYYIKKKIHAATLIDTLEKTFMRETKGLETVFAESGRSIDELVIMASILEKEANYDLEEKRVIAGILWKRLSIDMPLQVDATLKYYTGRGSADLTKEDLRGDHPYNTYTNKGLPPGPIGNPGYDSLLAAATPTPSDYLFYLHGRDGVARYAKNHNGHVRNIQMYLR